MINRLTFVSRFSVLLCSDMVDPQLVFIFGYPHLRFVYIALVDVSKLVTLFTSDSRLFATNRNTDILIATYWFRDLCKSLPGSKAIIFPRCCVRTPQRYSHIVVVVLPCIVKKSFAFDFRATFAEVSLTSNKAWV